MKVLSLAVALFVASASAAPGVRFGFPDGRIVGGADAVKHDFPWMVSLQLVQGSHICGGSIIKENYVLTAAHCVVSGRLQAVAGLHDLGKNEPTEQRFEVIQSTIHPDYAGGVGPHDIAVLRISGSFTYNAAVAPINLAPRDSIHAGNAVLSGWGSTSDSWTPSFPTILQTVTKPIVEYSECERTLGSSPLHPNNLCTGPLTGGISACSGDSGGPLIIDGANPIQVGIVSWGFIPCGSVGAPSVYVRVSAYIDWIDTNTSS